MTSPEAAPRAAEADPVVACAADDAYALPLAVTVRSLLDHLDPARGLELYVLDGGLTPASRERLRRSWAGGRVRAHFVPCETGSLGVPVGGHVSAMSYARILLPRLLPAQLDRVIYLDCDLVVLADVGRLWDLSLDGRACLAVQDASAPYLDAELALPRCAPHVLTPRPLENYAELGLDPHAKYFNAGVLLVDLARWREDDVAGRLLACIRANLRWIRFWDQYALNAVLSREWGELDARWNVSPYLASYGTWQHSALERGAFEAAVRAPWIVHFLGPDKPWQAGSRLRYAEHFHRHRARTAWAGWRGAAALASARGARERRRIRKLWGRARKRLKPRWRSATRWARQRLRRLRGALRGARPG